MLLLSWKHQLLKVAFFEDPLELLACKMGCFTPQGLWPSCLAHITLCHYDEHTGPALARIRTIEHRLLARSSAYGAFDPAALSNLVLA